MAGSFSTGIERAPSWADYAIVWKCCCCCTRLVEEFDRNTKKFQQPELNDCRGDMVLNLALASNDS